MRLQIASPKPVPGYSSSRCSRLKRPKIRSDWAGSNPIPLSLHAHHHVPIYALRSDVYAWRLVPLTIFQGVREQILKYVRELPLVALVLGQFVAGHLGVILANPSVHPRERLTQRSAQIRRAACGSMAACVARE